MIRTSRLSYTYKGGQSINFPDLRIDPGQHTLLLGPSGSGKSTLLHLVSGLLAPQEGTIEVLGQQLNLLSQQQKDSFRGANYGFVFQHARNFRSISVRQNLELIARHSVDRDHMSTLLQTLDLQHLSARKPDKLSQGEKQRLSIAMALVAKPKLLLADEPTSSLDDERCEAVINLLLEQSEKNGATLLIATHDQRVKSVIQNHVSL